MAAELNGRMWIVGGGMIDGEPELNANARREMWSSADGHHWVEGSTR